MVQGEENAGGVAQLGERLNGIQEVRGSIPLTSIPDEKSAVRTIRFIEFVAGLRE